MIRIEYLSYGYKNFCFPENLKEAKQIAEKLSLLKWVSDVKIFDESEAI